MLQLIQNLCLNNFQYFFRQYFVLTSYLTSLSIVAQRVDGSHDRLLVAGVEQQYIFISYFVEGLTIMLIQLMEFTTYTIFIFAPQITHNAKILISLLLFFDGLIGLVLGLLISTVSRSTMHAFSLCQLCILPTALLSGKNNGE